MWIVECLSTFLSDWICPYLISNLTDCLITQWDQHRDTVTNTHTDRHIGPCVLKTSAMWDYYGFVCNLERILESKDPGHKDTAGVNRAGMVRLEEAFQTRPIIPLQENYKLQIRYMDTIKQNHIACTQWKYLKEHVSGSSVKKGWEIRKKWKGVDRGGRYCFNGFNAMQQHL